MPRPASPRPCSPSREAGLGGGLPAHRGCVRGPTDLGNPGVVKLQGIRGEGELFSVEATGVLQQEGWWEDLSSSERIVAQRQRAACICRSATLAS